MPLTSRQFIIDKSLPTLSDLLRKPFSPSMDGKVVRVLTEPLTHTSLKCSGLAFQHRLKSLPGFFLF